MRKVTNIKTNPILVLDYCTEASGLTTQMVQNDSSTASKEISKYRSVYATNTAI